MTQPMQAQSRLLALVGSTASGKSDLALRLAQETGAAILSCDSLLVYRELDIGTAKPSAEERARAPHYGIDIADLSAAFTAGDYVRYAAAAIQKLVETERRPVLIVGGTGFYLKALLCGVWDAPPTQEAFRAEIERELSSVPKERQGPLLHARLTEADPLYAEKVNPNDLYRVIRALEIMHVTGEPVSARLQHTGLQSPLPYEVPVLGIRRGKPELEKRIVARCDDMFARGLVVETKTLRARFPDEPRALHCVGYHEVLQFLDGKMTLPECRERVVISTRQLAKKQMTFFKTFPKPISWFDLPRQEEALYSRALEILSGSASPNRVE